MTTMFQCPVCGKITKASAYKNVWTSPLSDGKKHPYYYCRNKRCKGIDGKIVAVFANLEQTLPIYVSARGKRTYYILPASKNPARGQQEALEDKTTDKNDQISQAGLGGFGTTLQQQSISSPQFLQQPQGRRKRSEPLLDTFFKLLSVRKGGKVSSNRTLLQCKKCNDIIHVEKKEINKHLKNCYHLK